MELQILEVSQVNAYIKGLFDRDALLGQVCVQGELSNYKVYPSGHHYFTMKDAEGALRCVMVPLERGAAALQTGERDAGAGRGADHGISARRSVSALL